MRNNLLQKSFSLVCLLSDIEHFLSSLRFILLPSDFFADLLVLIISITYTSEVTVDVLELHPNSNWQTSYIFNLSGKRNQKCIWPSSLFC
jgi:hypothetical protein